MAQDEASKNEVQTLADIDRFIHEPARLLILALLSVVDSADFTFVSQQTGLSRGNLSVQMTKLEAAGYLTITKEFVERIPRTLLRITPQGRQAFNEYRRSMIGALGNLSD